MLEDVDLSHMAGAIMIAFHLIQKEKMDDFFIWRKESEPDFERAVHFLAIQYIVFKKKKNRTEVNEVFVCSVK